MLKPGMWAGAGIGLLAASLMAGCLSDADRSTDDSAAAAAATASGETCVEAWDASGPPGFPTTAELQAALQLTNEQTATVDAALNEWRTRMEEQRRQREQRRNAQGHGMPGAFGENEPPMLAFLSAVVPVLDAGQVATMAGLLEQKRNEAGEPGMGPGGPGGPGMRPGGGRGGPGGPGGPGFGGPIGRVLHELRDQLDLSADQRTALHDALKESHDTFRDLRQQFRDGTITAEELRDAAHDARVALEEQLADILSADQYTLLMDTLAEYRTEMINRRLANLEEGAARRLEFLQTVLQLDDTQTAQVQSILNDSMDTRRTILESLRDGVIEIEEALYQGYVLAQSTAAAIRDVLTPEQQAVFDALRPLLPGHGGPHHP